MGMQQLVEVAKAISIDARLLIMDEPTSSLSENEIDELFKVIGDLRNQGLAILFVSHKLSELFKIADRVTVLRDGRLVATAETSSLTTNDLIRMMVGRQLASLYPPARRRSAMSCSLARTCRALEPCVTSGSKCGEEKSSGWRASSGLDARKPCVR